MASYFKLWLCIAFLLIASGGFAQHNFQKVYERLIDTQNDYKKALASGDSLEIAEMCYRLGKRYIGLNNYVESQKWLLRSLSIRKHHGPPEDLAKVYSVLSETYIYMHNMLQHVHYSHLARENFRKSNSLRALMIANRISGSLHHIIWKNQIKDPDFKHFKPSPDSAAWYYKKALHYAEKLKITTDIAMAHEFLGSLAFDQNNIEAGIQEFRHSFDLFSKDQKRHNVIVSQTTLANALLEKNQLQKAKYWLNKSLALANEVKDLTTYGELIGIDLALSSYYQKTGDWQAAFRHQQRYDNFMLKERDAYRDGAIAGLNIVHEHEKKELKLLHSEKELSLLRQSERTQTALIWILACICCIATVLGFLFHYMYKKYQSLNEQNKGLVKEQSHRIKNNLQSVSDLLGLQLLKMTDPMAISVIEESLSRVETISLIHRHLYSDEHLDTINLKTFIPDLVGQVLRSYNQHSVEVEFEIQEILLFVDQAISLGLIVNELATNSSKYAFTNNPSPKLNVTVRLSEQRVNVDFSDNGPGFVQSDENDTFGLRIITLLTQKLKGSSHFTNTSGSCHFNLSFPISVRSKYPASGTPKLFLDHFPDRRGAVCPN